MIKTSPDPRALFAWSGATLVVALATTSPVMRAAAAGCSLLVVISTARDRTRARRTLKAVGFVAALAIAFNLLLSHVGNDVVVHLPDWLPVVGGDVTWESAAYGGDVALGLGAALLAVAPLALAVNPSDVLNALPRFLERTGTVVATAVRLVPQVARSFTEVREAQQLRGWKPRGVRAWSDVLVPVMLTAMEDSIQLAESMDARAYGSGPRTSYTPLKWAWSDTVVTAAAGIATAAFVVGKFVGGVPDWYPYPSPDIPAVNAIVLAAVLLLVIPAFLWRSRSSTG